MLWVEEAALAGWQAPRRSTPGGQPRCSELAIELVLTLRLVFHLPVRQAEGFASSVLHLLGMVLPVPDHTTLSRRGRAFAGRQPRVQAGTGPMHLVLDSTGLELFGQGEWCAAKHGRLRRRWLKLHLGVDASTGEIAVHVLTDGDEDDAAQAPVLLRQCEGTLASLTADGAYDRDPVYQAAAARQPGLGAACPRRVCWIA
jgi:IS5 family transposase